MYSADMGRPNRAVQTVLGVLVLKEMFDLGHRGPGDYWSSTCCGITRWGMGMEEARKRRCTTSPVDGARRGAVGVLRDADRIEALGLRTGKQRVEHIMARC